MLLLTVILLLAAVPDQSLEQEDDEEEEDDKEEEDDEEEEEEWKTEISLENKKTIIDKHNQIRRDVKPPAANMLKMQVPLICLSYPEGTWTEDCPDVLFSCKKQRQVWNDTIAKSAQKWAEKCKLDISAKEDRSFDGVMCSENIFYTNFPSTWSNAIQAWEKRKTYFKYGYGAVDTSRSIASYTQLIWYNSYQTGCGLARCPGEVSFFYYVCQYCPAANREDLLARPYRKGRPCQDCRKACENKLCTNPCKHTDTTRHCRELKSLYGCKKPLLKKGCEATCLCKTEII